MELRLESIRTCNSLTMWVQHKRRIALPLSTSDPREERAEARCTHLSVCVNSEILTARRGSIRMPVRGIETAFFPSFFCVCVCQVRDTDSKTSVDAHTSAWHRDSLLPVLLRCVCEEEAFSHYTCLTLSFSNTDIHVLERKRDEKLELKNRKHTHTYLS